MTLMNESMSRLQRKFTEFKRKNCLLLLVLVIIVLALIPVYYTWNRLAIGGDILIPFNSIGIEKFLYQWIPVQNGLYAYANYFPLYFFYRFIEFFGLTIYQISSILLFLLNLIAGFGIYKLIKLFYEKDDLYVSIPILFYLLSPALLNGGHFLWIYSFIPWFLYFIFKTIKNKKIKTRDLIWLNIIVFFSSLDLPNPKYIFHLYLIAGLILTISILFNLINQKFLLKNSWKILIFILMSSYLYLPVGYFAINYSPDDYGTYVKVKQDYKDVGKMMDFGSATLDRMFRLHHDNIILNTDDKKKYNSNLFISFFGYSFILLIIINFIFRKKRDPNHPYEFILLVLTLIYLFFASGPNPPFGFVYEYIVSNYSGFAFLRTTAGAVFYLSSFYSVLLFSFINNLKSYKRVSSIFIIISIFFVSYPLINGEYYKNVNNVNLFTDREEYGFKIPNEYFEIKEKIDQQKIDAKTLHPLSNLDYLNTNWGFFGPNIYNFLYPNYNIGNDKIYSSIANHNVGFIFKDKSLTDLEIQFKIKTKIEIIKIDFLELERVSKDDFLPHFYTPKNIIFLNETTENIIKTFSKDDHEIRSAIFLEKQNNKKTVMLSSLQNIINKTPIIEFKKINPTKYRLKIHKSSEIFPIVFSENYNDGWKTYLVKSEETKINRNVISKYKLLDGNDEYQATKQDLIELIDNGWVTTLEDVEEKEIKHKKWDSTKETLDYNEKYYINFISKNFQDTIQNDNLHSGEIYETWFIKPIEHNENHIIVNGYANSWIIDPAKLCSQNDKCIKNTDGSYDFEMVVEFWPQRLSYIGFIISGTTFLLCIIYLIYDWRRKNDLCDKRIEKNICHNKITTR